MSDFSWAAPFLQKQTLLCALENSKLAKLSKKLLPGVNVTRYRSGKRGAGLTCSHRTPAVTYSEMWGEFMKSLRSTSARKKRKSSLVQKGIYSTSGFLPHRSHLSCRAPVTFLLLLKPDWCCRGCCGLLDKRGGDAKADVFQSCYAQTPPPPPSPLIRPLDKWNVRNLHIFLPSPPSDAQLLISGWELNSTAHVSGLTPWRILSILNSAPVSPGALQGLFTCIKICNSFCGKTPRFKTLNQCPF